jgi:hypothetical protein
MQYIMFAGGCKDSIIVLVLAAHPIVWAVFALGDNAIMRTLRISLLQHDIALLRVIGEQWGVDLAGLSLREAAERLDETIRGADLPAELVDLPPGEHDALQALLAAGGRMLADPFLRQFGPIRPFGPSRLMREHPWVDPASPAEGLWYRGLIFRAFEQTDLGGQEFIYLPSDIRSGLPVAKPGADLPRLAPARGALQPLARGKTSQQPPAAALVDDCCTLLAYAQRNLISVHAQPAVPYDSLSPFLRYKDYARLEMIFSLALEAGLLRQEGDAIRPGRDETLKWLQAPYPDEGALLVKTWLDSVRWNDLWHVPGLEPEPTGWENDPRLPRQLMFKLLAQLGSSTWWSLASLAPAVKKTVPDFQRTAGEYESWYLRDTTTGQFLLGFQHWDNVEGALLHFLVVGTLNWLGLIELAQDEDGAVVAFRPTAAGQSFAQVGSFPYPPGPSQARISIMADATITVPLGVDRLTRFQVARLADWEPVSAVYRYRLTPNSLTRARKNGIPLTRALAFLASRSGQPLPESVKEAVTGWERDGVRVRLRQLYLLQVKDEATLDRLRAAPEVRSLLGETIGPLAVSVRTTDWPRLVGAIAKLGLLSDVEGISE